MTTKNSGKAQNRAFPFLENGRNTRNVSEGKINSAGLAFCEGPALFFCCVPFCVPFSKKAVLAAFQKISKKYLNKTKRAENYLFPLSKVGADSQIRTGDLILTKDALYLLSYISKYYAPPGGALWRPRRDLNPRPPA